MAIFSLRKEEDLPLFKEPAADFEAGELLLDEEGDAVILFGREALSCWIYKAMHMQSARFEYPSHTKDYGNEFYTLFGRGTKAAQSLLPQMIQDVLLANPYITQVGEPTFKVDGDALTVTFTLDTVYGDLTYESEAVYF